MIVRLPILEARSAEASRWLVEWSISDDPSMGRRDQTTCSVSAQAGRTSPGAEHALLYGGGELRMRLEGGALWRCPRGGADDSDFAICSGAESSPLEHRGRAQVSALLRVSEACDARAARPSDGWWS